MKIETEISWGKWIVLGCMLLFAGVQNAIAACAGTLHFKKPDGWPGSFYIAMKGVDALVTEEHYNAATGYYEYDLAEAGGEDAETSFAIVSATTAPMNYILSNVWNGVSEDDQSYPKDNRNLKCPGAGKDIYVLENPKKKNTIFLTNVAPDIKYFYVLVPGAETWKSTVPMWSGNASFGTGQLLRADSNSCGWYYAVWVEEPLPDRFIIFRDDDEDLEDAIGMNGWRAKDLTPFPMEILFVAYESDKVYFIADSAKAEKLGVPSISGVDPQVDNCTDTLPAFLFDADEFKMKVRPSFMTMSNTPSTITISVSSSANAKFAVMDLQGRVVRQGMLAGAETVVPNLKPGSYIVKVARETRRVTVR